MNRRHIRYWLWFIGRMLWPIYCDCCCHSRWFRSGACSDHMPPGLHWTGRHGPNSYYHHHVYTYLPGWRLVYTIKHRWEFRDIVDWKGNYR